MSSGGPRNRDGVMTEVYATAREMLADLAAKRISARELLELHVARNAALHARLNALVATDLDRARDKRLPALCIARQELCRRRTRGPRARRRRRCLGQDQCAALPWRLPKLQRDLRHDEQSLRRDARAGRIV